MRVSIVIPTYNGERFIEQTILSVLGQERAADEVLVCDDGSTDDTLEICARFCGRVDVYSNPSGPSGFVRSWNKAIERATGDYISIIHQDDLLAPAFIRTAMELLEKTSGVRHLFTTCQYINERSEGVGVSYWGEEEIVRLTGAEYVKMYQQLGEPHIHRCPGVVTHRSIFDECRYEAGAGHIADDDFFYRVGMFTDVIGVLTPMASFRVHSGSVTGLLPDAELAGNLMDDYLYQCRQWQGHPFMDDAGYRYFVHQAGKYIRRYIGYGVRRLDAGMIWRGLESRRILNGLKKAGGR